MNYIENIYVCLAAPLIIAILCMNDSRRKLFIFMLAGMTACLVSSYISSFLTSVHGVAMVTASTEITPFVEESMKILPVLFYLVVMEPKKEELMSVMLIDSVGFATFENACYMTESGSDHLLHLLVRGFGTGSMHVVTGMIVAIGLYYLWDRLHLRFAGTVGLLSLAATYHAIFNLLAAQRGPASTIGLILPVLTVLFMLTFGRHFLKKILAGSLY